MLPISPRRTAFRTRRAWTGWIAALCLLLATQLARAGPAPTPGPPPLRDYAIDAWSTRNGLPHNSVRDIAQTVEGYLWFATWEGVVRYNGLEFTAFDRGTTPGLRDNGVDVADDAAQGDLFTESGRIWETKKIDCLSQAGVGR